VGIVTAFFCIIISLLGLAIVMTLLIFGNNIIAGGLVGIASIYLAAYGGYHLRGCIDG